MGINWVNSTLWHDMTPVSLVSEETNDIDDMSLCDKFNHVTDLHFPAQQQT